MAKGQATNPDIKSEEEVRLTAFLSITPLFG